MSMLIAGLFVLLMAISCLTQTDSSINECLPKDAIQQCYLVSLDSKMVITYRQSDKSIILMPKSNQNNTNIIQKWSIKQSKRKNGDYMISSKVSKLRTIHWNYDEFSCTMKGDDLIVDRIRLKFDQNCYMQLATTNYECGKEVIDKCECDIGFNENQTEIFSDARNEYNLNDENYQFLFKFECNGTSKSSIASINLLGIILFAIGIYFIV